MDRVQLNQKFADLLKAIRGKYGIEEDRLKKIGALEEATKEASREQSDSMGSSIDPLRSIRQQIQN